MDNQTQVKRITAVGNTLTALKKAKWSRWYAIDDANLIALAALVSEWAQVEREIGQPTTNEATAKFIEGLADFIPSLFQRRPPDEKAPPQLWKDPVTGETPPNPFSKGTLNLTEQSWLQKNEPDLAQYLEGTANGLSYSYLKKQRDEKAAREKIRKIDYGAEQHSNNIFRSSSNLTERDAFRKTVGDHVADFYKHEAETPVHLPWVGKQNLTEMGRLFRSEGLNHLVTRSVATAKEWAKEQLVESEKKFAESQAQMRAAKELLAAEHQTNLRLAVKR